MRCRYMRNWACALTMPLRVARKSRLKQAAKVSTTLAATAPVSGNTHNGFSHHHHHPHYPRVPHRFHHNSHVGRHDASFEDDKSGTPYWSQPVEGTLNYKCSQSENAIKAFYFDTLLTQLQSWPKETPPRLIFRLLTQLQSWPNETPPRLFIFTVY